MKYFVRTAKGQRGPVAARTLKSWANSGRITPNDLVRIGRKGRWYRADAVDGLFSDERIRLDTRPPALPTQRQRSVKPNQDERGNPHRTVLILLLIVLLCATPFYPGAAFLAAILLGLLIVCLVVPGIRSGSRCILGVKSGQPFRTLGKTALIAMYAIIFCIAGLGSSAFHKSMAESRKRQAIAAEAAARRKEAADARAQVLLTKALEAIQQDDLEVAADALRELLALPDVSSKQFPARLSVGIRRIRWPDELRQSLVAMDDSDFHDIVNSGRLPQSLRTGNDALDAKLLEVSTQAAPTVIADREQRAKEAAAAAEARAQAEQQARLDRLQAERRQEDAERQLLESRHEKLLALLNSLNEALGVQLFDSVKVSREAGSSWRATITVTNLWHARHKQVRLQDAQTLWAAWANIASPDDPDRAFIKLVDYNGNSVGGSGWLAGSLISVPD